jgi:uncharacterized protein
MHGEIPLRTFAPAGQSRGAVLFFHGLRASSDNHEREARSLAENGFTAMLVDAPHHGRRRSALVDTMPSVFTIEGHRALMPVLQQARDEIPVLVEHARALGHRFVAALGISMGGFTALSSVWGATRPSSIVSIFGSPDWTPRDGYVPEDLGAVVAESPARHPSKFAPTPLLMINGGRDDNVRPAAARALADELAPHYAQRAPGTFEYHELADVDHFPSDPQWSDIWSRVLTFLGRHAG